MKKIALILCLVLVASFVLSGCNNSDSIITLEDREVGKIEIQSGNTGETVEVTEEEVISQIADILSLEFEKGEKSNDSTGWSYSVRWYDTEGKQIDTVVIMNDGTIEKDGYFWKTSKDNIELSVFDELVTKHSSELPLEWDKIPMVMVDGKLYYDTGKESTVSARCGVMDGEITSTVDGSEIPTKDNQSNFGTGFEYQYGADNTIEIFMNEKWIVFEQREGTGNQVRFGDRMVDADGLSEETLEWLDWYNSLPEEQQLAISAVPPDLLEESGLGENAACEVTWVFEDVAEGEDITPEQEKRISDIVTRRCEGYPLQYLLGQWEFYGLPFKVGEGVLIPRQDTETIVDTALKLFADKKDITVIDLCSGSGCIGITLERKLDCGRAVCVEKSEKAAEYLRENISLNGSGAEIVMGDVTDEKLVEDMPEADLIVCNPPYLTTEDMDALQREVTFEPAEALFGGEDGLDFYREIVRKWKKKLKSGGVMLFEIGIGQEDEVMRLMIQHGFKNVRCRKDLCGVYRCVSGIYEK